MAKRDFQPIHPGEILLEEFLHPMAISQYRLAKDISVPQRRISEIVQGETVNHGGYCASIWKIFRDGSTVLAEPSISLQFTKCRIWFR